LEAVSEDADYGDPDGDKPDVWLRGVGGGDEWVYVDFLIEAASAAEAVRKLQDELARYIGMVRGGAPEGWEQTVALYVKPEDKSLRFPQGSYRFVVDF
jgi:hypothetical protein